MTQLLAPPYVTEAPFATMTFYQTGTLTLATAYSDGAQTVPLPNPIRADAQGRFAPVYLNSTATYRIIIRDLAGGLIRDIDPVNHDSLRAELASTGGAALIATASGKTVQQVFDGITARSAATVYARDVGITFDGVTDDTNAWNAAINNLQAAGGGTIVMPQGTSMVSSIVATIAIGVAVNLVGQGASATIITKNDNSTTPIINFSAPTATPVGMLLQDFLVNGRNKLCPGIQLTNLAEVVTQRIGVVSCATGLNSRGCLTSTHNNARLTSNATGFACAAFGGVYANLVEFYGGVISGNGTYGVDLNNASHLSFYGTDFEENGTAGNVNTGGARVRNGMASETGVSSLLLTTCWFERNHGRTFVVDSQAGFHLTMQNVKLAAPEANQAAVIGDIVSVTLINIEAGGPGDLVAIGACAASTIIGGLISALTDTSLSRQRFGLSTGSGLYKFASSGCGQTVLVAGVKAVSYPALSIGENIIVTTQLPGGSIGYLHVDSKIPGTGFTIVSSSATDTSTVSWFAVAPA